MKDLFGNEISLDQARILEAMGKKKRKTTQPKGYAAQPGSGPAGETCKTCTHSRPTGPGNHTYWKCELIRRAWTHGPGTDIRLKAPACKFWEASK
jgi:hypothetical protein